LEEEAVGESEGVEMDDGLWGGFGWGGAITLYIRKRLCEKDEESTSDQ